MTNNTRLRYTIDLELADGADPAAVTNKFNLDVIDLVNETEGLYLGGESSFSKLDS